jgi:hypothetical protein
MKGIDKRLKIILLLAISIVIIIDFWLINIPEKVVWGYEFGFIIRALSMAYIASFIFYFVTVHIKSKRDKRNIKPYISKCISDILGIHNGIHNSIQNTAKPDIYKGNIMYTKEEYLEFLSKIINNGDRINPIGVIINSPLKIPTLIFLLSQISVVQNILKECVNVSQIHNSELVKTSTLVLNSEILNFLITNEYYITNQIIVLDNSNIEIISEWLSEYDKNINSLFEYLKRL